MGEGTSCVEGGILSVLEVRLREEGARIPRRES